MSMKSGHRRDAYQWDASFMLTECRTLPSALMNMYSRAAIFQTVSPQRTMCCRRKYVQLMCYSWTLQCLYSKMQILSIQRHVLIMLHMNDKQCKIINMQISLVVEITPLSSLTTVNKQSRSISTVGINFHAQLSNRCRFTCVLFSLTKRHFISASMQFNCKDNHYTSMLMGHCFVFCIQKML